MAFSNSAPFRSNKRQAVTCPLPTKYAFQFTVRRCRLVRSRRFLSATHQGHPLTKKWTGAALRTISSVAGRPVTIDMLHSTMGRHVARAIRAAMLSELAQKHWQLLVGISGESYNAGCELSPKA
ncbi:MAG TPA: nickel-dependent hydrogenase large subunit [Clostridia bacterium]|nr:nickel-dependent hydrogenase large subunit [Clostridia bacterium]